MSTSPSARVLAIVQARMSSRRFPGKVLAPFAGRPVLAHVIERVRAGMDGAAVVVATSETASDDPLAAYVESLGVTLFRGPLDDVLGRFAQCARQYCRPDGWVLRISADSPLMNPDVIRQILSWRDRAEADLITTVFPRSLPHGWSAELLRCDLLDRLEGSVTAPDEREHVTLHCYRNPARFGILGLVDDGASAPSISLAVDTLEDLRRLESQAPAAVTVRLAPAVREAV